MAVCFTGHRPKKFGTYDETSPVIVNVKARLKEKILEQIEEGHRLFITGGALGVDTWAAEIILDLKSEYPDLRLTVAAPCYNYDSKWNAPSRQRAKIIAERADSFLYVNECEYNPQVMSRRNYWMVNHSDTVIAVWTGAPGGTENCIRYAHSRGRKVIYIVPKDRNDLPKRFIPF
jgi:uncharacterized phage-like protein YoqJ